MACRPRRAGGRRGSRRRGGRRARRLPRGPRRAAASHAPAFGFATGLDVVDLGGITDPTIARRPGGHVDKAIDPGVLLERDPDTIVLSSRLPPAVDDQGRLRRFAGHPVEARVAAMPWVRARMRVTRVQRYSSGLWYVVLSR
ncbi:MAG: hypothetical protein R3B82_28235 [Sandaracinaceae bacterium]